MHTIVKRMIPALALVIFIVSGGAAANDGQPVADGTYKVVSALDRDYVWEIADDSGVDEGNLQTGRDRGSKSQQFIFTYQTDGYYTIANVNSGRMVECANGGYADGTNIWQYLYDNSDTQRWKLIRTGDGCFALKCRHNGKVADIEEGLAASGQNIQAYKYNGTPAQQFRLVAVTTGEVAAVKRSSIWLYRGIYLLVAAAAVCIVAAGFRRQK